MSAGTYLDRVKLRKKNLLEDQGCANSLTVATSGLDWLTYSGLCAESVSVLCGWLEGPLSWGAGSTSESGRCVRPIILMAQEPSMAASTTQALIVARRLTAAARSGFVVGPA